jgi:hypothetical protein
MTAVLGIFAAQEVVAAAAPLVWPAASPAQLVLADLVLFSASSLSYLAVPLTLAVAVLRHRLWDIDLLINRALVYGSLSATLALTYVGSVVLLQGLVRTLTGQDSELAIIASTLAIAGLFQPLRRMLQSFIDRRFYRRKYDAARTLETFSARLRDEVDLSALTAELVGVVDDTMRPSSVSLWIRPPASKRSDSS